MSSAARAAKGVAAVITAEDVTRFGAPLLAGVKANIQCWPIAVGKRALCRRAGGGRGRGGPLSRRGRAGADRGRVRAAADHAAPRRCAEARQRRAARRARRQHRERPLVPLRRSGGRVRARRASRVGQGQLSAQLLHADRNLRARRRLRSGRGRLRCARDLPGPVQHPRGAGARAESAGQPAAAAHAARCGRQLRREAGHLPLHRR